MSAGFCILPTTQMDQLTSLTLRLLTRLRDQVQLGLSPSNVDGRGQPRVSASGARTQHACNVSLVAQLSHTVNCSYGQHYGCDGPQRIWAGAGCRGVFRCGGQIGQFRCGFPPGRGLYTCHCDGHDDWFWANRGRVNPRCAAWNASVRREDSRRTDALGAVHSLPVCRLATRQRIPRVVHQTAPPEIGQLPAGMARAAASWFARNPDYEHVYYSDAALAAYVRRHGREVPGFDAAHAAARSGAERADLWRALVVWREGGVYADIDTQCLTALYAVIRPHDDAVSGVGHREHGPEQFLLAYAPRHPIIERYLFDAVAGVNAGAAGGVVNLTGPSALYRAAISVLGLPPGAQFEGGTYLAVGSNRSLRILDGNYTCPTGGVYGCAIINSFSNNVRFKYAGYENELKRAGSTHWSAVDRRVPRGSV